jgi:hypothetical protein
MDLWKIISFSYVNRFLFLQAIYQVVRLLITLPKGNPRYRENSPLLMVGIHCSLLLLWQTLYHTYKLRYVQDIQMGLPSVSTVIRVGVLAGPDRTDNKPSTGRLAGQRQIPAVVLRQMHGVQAEEGMCELAFLLYDRILVAFTKRCQRRKAEGQRAAPGAAGGKGWVT